MSVKENNYILKTFNVIMILFVVYVIIALCNFCIRNNRLSNKNNISSAYIKIIDYKPARGSFYNVVYSFCYNNKKYIIEEVISYGNLNKFDNDSMIVIFDTVNPYNCKISKDLSKPSK
jgi:hypothetical protein